MLHRIHDLLGLEVPSGMKSIQVHGPPNITEKEEKTVYITRFAIGILNYFEKRGRLALL